MLPTTDRLRLRILVHGHVVLLKFVFSCSHFYPVHVQQFSHWRNWTVGGPRTLCLIIINWSTCLKRLRTLMYRATLNAALTTGAEDVRPQLAGSAALTLIFILWLSSSLSTSEKTFF